VSERGREVLQKKKENREKNIAPRYRRGRILLSLFDYCVSSSFNE